MKRDFIDLEDFGGGKFGMRDFKLPEFRLSPWLLLLIVLLIWLGSGFYMLKPGHHGVIQTFGKHTGTALTPGLHYRLPSPVQSVTPIWVSEFKRVEIGFRTVKYSATSPEYQDVSDESEMLTADENIVDAELAVQYVIDPDRSADWLFKVKDPEQAMMDVCMAAFRTVVGMHTLDEIMLEGKSQIQVETGEMVQEIADSYSIGIKVTNVQLQEVQPPPLVIDAFKDVASAREDKNRRIEQAKELKNEIVPKANGEAKQLVNEAKGYKAKVVNEAKGDALRFSQVLEEYSKAKEVTRRRLYIEALEEVFPGMKKVLVEDESGVLKLLPLEKLQGGGQ
jgi:membrane protease subunit HflK